MKRKAAYSMLAVGLAVVLVAAPAMADHDHPWIEGSGQRVNMFAGSVELAPDEPFHIRHGWSGLGALRDQWHKEFWVTLAYTTQVDDPFSMDGLFVPTLTTCDPVPGSTCQTFLFDFPDGIEGALGPGFSGPVRLDMTWYGSCGGLAELGSIPECPEGIDEDRSVAALSRSIVVDFIDAGS